MKDPVKHDDGTVTVHYEVPAGNNECLELFKKITPLVRPVPRNRCDTWNEFQNHIEHSKLLLAVEINREAINDVVGR